MIKMYKILLPIFVIAGSLRVSQALLKFEDENVYGLEADRLDWSTHPCNRPCDDYNLPKTCYYRFVVEKYLTMSKACYDCPRNPADCFRPHCLPGDGINKVIFSVNRLLPGPHIQVCLGDKIIVDVKNAMHADSTTIHWHGLRQIDSPYMDGVPLVTQCPIPVHGLFRYQFNADQSGTYFWHSHIAGQRVDGLFGALTIRSPPKYDPHRDLYDYDKHSMVLSNWHAKVSQEDIYTTLTQIGPQNPSRQTILINGLGRFKNFAQYDEEPIYVPSEVFTVQQGYRYRFRLVNAGADSAIQVSIDHHAMLLLSADSQDIVPIEVESIYMWPGERYDFVLNADQEVDNYWFRYRLHVDNANVTDTDIPVYQVAILRYEGAPLEDPAAPVDWDALQSSKKLRILNPFLPFRGSRSHKAIKITSLKALAENDELTDEYVDQQFYLGFNPNPIDEYEYHRANIYGFDQVKEAGINVPIATFQFNRISFTLPSIPVLPQRNMITPQTFCNATTLADKDCEHEECTCTHMLQVKLNSVVELIIVDQDNSINFNHPMHLHGHFFRVIASEKLQGPVTLDRVKQLDYEGQIKRTLDRPPVKDTMMIPYGGYTILRFRADNPGYWIFHCHFNPHIELGMALLFKVGEHEDMLPVPKNFPRCGNYLPTSPY